MFTKRLVSGIILVILAIIIVGKGGALLYGVTALISLIGLFELYRVLKIEKNAMGVVGYLTALSYYGLVWFDGHHYVTLMAIAALDGNLCLYLSEVPDRRGGRVLFWRVLCGGDAVLSVSGPRHGRRKVSGMADLLKLLGLRHQCLLCWHAAREA